MKKISGFLFVLILVHFLAQAPAVADDAPSSTKDLLNLKSDADFQLIQGDPAANLTLWHEGDQRGVKVDFGTSQGFPGASFPCPGDGFDLTGYVGVEALVTNVGKTTISVDLRVDDNADISTQPWDAETTQVGPGETKTIRVTFGINYGVTGHNINVKHISRILIYSGHPSAEGSFVVKKLQAVK